MKAAVWTNGIGKALILGLIVAAFVLAPFGAVHVNADGASGGQPGTPPDSTLDKPALVDPSEAYEPLVTASTSLTLLRFIEW